MALRFHTSREGELSFFSRSNYIGWGCNVEEAHGKITDDKSKKSYSKALYLHIMK